MFAWGSVVPDVGHHMQYPSFCLGTIEILRCLITAMDKSLNESDQWLMKFAQIAWFCNPVIHLDIYVGVVVSVPRGVETVGPQSLQVRWKAARACA